MVKISDKKSESLSEYLILTGWIKGKAEDVSLKAKLGDKIVLQYPYMTARMQCVVGPGMAVAAGRNGILTCIPRSLRDIDKQAIIDANNAARLKKGDVEHIAQPDFVDPEDSLEEVVALVNKTGHSVIPILDWNKKLYGFYVHNPDDPKPVPPKTPIKVVMTPLRTGKSEYGIPFYYESDESVKRAFQHKGIRFFPVVNKDMILQELAFLQAYDTNFIGISISTRKDWGEELEKWGPQVDTLMIDSSNACFPDAVRILKEAKKRFPDKPFGIGNIVQGRDFRRFAKEGADYIIGGMGVGSICQTGSIRGNGRGQFTVARELSEARNKLHKTNGIYIPIVIDGGISNLKDLTVALALGDFVMMGNYFNKFYEAAGKKLDENKSSTSEEALIRFIETWGEGHPKARLVAMFGMDYEAALRRPSSDDIERVVERYGHKSISSATVEGVAGEVPYRGRLRPCVEEDARYIRTTIANAGASNLTEFRKSAILERVSAQTLRDMLPHGIDVKG